MLLDNENENLKVHEWISKYTEGEKIDVNGTEVTIFQKKESDYISLTDIAKHKNSDDPRFVI